MGVTWYTADLHISHRLVAGHRGFGEDTDAHDAEIVERWMKVVRDDDIVYILGDLAVSNPYRALALLAELPGRKRLIFGNHDVGPQHRDAPRWFPRYLEVFEWATPYARRRIAGQEVLLSHYPYATSPGADHGEVRYTQWRLPDMGAWLLHGHTHSTEIHTSDREIHVGWDAWRRLVAEHEIEEFIRNGGTS